MYHYTYIIKYTTGMYYLGVRSSKVPPEQDTEYIGSSHHTPDDKVERKQILRVFKTREDALKDEIFWHETYNIATNPQFYNKAKQTSTKFDTTGVKIPWSKEHYENLAKANKARAGWRHTEESKRKMSEKQKGKPGPIHSAETRALLSKKLKGKPCKYKGYTYTKEEADRIYAKKDKYQMKFHWINHYTGKKEYLTCRDFSDKYIDSPNRLMIANNVINARPRQRNRGGIIYRNWKGWYLDPAYLLPYKTA